MKKLSGYIRLTRPYVLLSTSLLFIGPTFLSVDGIPPARPFLTGFLAVILAIAAAHISNDYFDWKIDAKNPRTAKRPIPTGLISPYEALFTGLVLGIIAFASTLLLNASSTLIAIVAVPLPFIYTYFKRHKIPLGFVCPVMAVVLIILFGCASVTGKMIEGHVWLLLILGLVWEPGRDFISEIQDVAVDKAEGILTLPVILSPKAAAKCVLALFSVTSIIGVLVGVLARLGIPYLAVASLAGLWLIYRSIGLVNQPTTKNAVKMRVRAPVYLMAISIGIAIDFIISRSLA